MKNFSSVILAAGKGTRLNAGMPKPLVPLHGKPLIQPIIERSRELGMRQIVIVISEFTKEIRERFPDPDITYVMAEPKGTGFCAAAGVAAVTAEHVVITHADDSYFYSRDLLERLMQTHLESKATYTVGYIHTEHFFPWPYLEHQDGIITKIGSSKEDLQKEPPKDVVAGLYAGEVAWLQQELPKLIADHSGEVPLPNIVINGLEQHKKMGAFEMPLAEWHGVNTQEELQLAKDKIGQI